MNLMPDQEILNNTHTNVNLVNPNKCICNIKFKKIW